MQVTAKRRRAARPTSALPALAAFLMVSAGVAAIAQPLEEQRQPAGIGRTSPGRAATIRIVLPPPVAMAPVQRRASTGTLRILLRDLGPVAPAAPAPAALAASAVPAPPSSVPAAIAAVGAIAEPDAEADLAKARSGEGETFSATMREISDSLAAASPPAGKERGAALARIDDLPGLTASATDRSASLVGSRPTRPDPVASTERVQMILTEAMKPKKRSVASVSLQVSATVNGAAAGRVSLLINDDENIQILLSDLLAILEPAIDPALYARLSGSEAAEGYMTLNELRAEGIRVRFDDRDRLVLTTL